MIKMVFIGIQLPLLWSACDVVVGLAAASLLLLCTGNFRGRLTVHQDCRGITTINVGRYRRQYIDERHCFRPNSVWDPTTAGITARQAMVLPRY